MFELTTLNVFTAAENGLISFAAEPVEKPDPRFICVGLGDSDSSGGSQSIYLTGKHGRK
jgi:hypothetical protein